MKYIFFFFFTLLFSFNGYGQIKTPSFSKYNQCPTTPSLISNCPGWRQPTWGTSDYFNSCASTVTMVSVPENDFGYQDNAIHAYAGLAAPATSIGSFFDYREYIACATRALTVGKTYTMSITVSLSDSSNVATDGLGVLFSTRPLYFESWAITLIPQIDFSSYGPITDKANWVTLTGSFVADSAYKHLIVGCFKPLSSLVIDTIPGPSFFGGARCYYYIGEIGIPDSTYFGDSTYTGGPIDTAADYIFPNAFTPNNDGRNDVFRIKGKAYNNYKVYTLRVYNRLGQCVFMSHDPDHGWDGSQNGIPCDFGVYFYFAEFGLNNEHHLVKGDMTLVR